jgi:DNA damage-inducible protein 1
MINLEGTDQCREFNITRDITVEQLKIELSKIYKIPSNQIEILLNDYPLQNSQFLSKIGIGNNLLTLRKKSLQSSMYNNITPNQNNININTSSHNLNQSQALLRSNYNNMANINQSQSNININNINNTPNLSNSFQTNPELLGLSSSAIINDAIAYNNLFGTNLNNPQMQSHMEDIIQRQRINDNFRKAAEIMPESLVPVHMLYINVEVNKLKTQALIDTGAQSSFMSANLCQKCGLFNLMDKRFQGIARGVGASRILGVIHAAEIKILNKVILARVNVIENNDVGFVLGLDNLRKYNCNVDLKKNGLVFPDIGITAKFLSDGEINKFKQEKEQQEEDEEIELAKLESLNYV